MDKTKIQWTRGDDGTPGATWNPLRGCTRVSTGCVHCFAEAIASRFSDPGMAFEGFATRTSSGPRWTGKVVLVESALDQPLRWRRPRRIFVNSMSDLFHESVPDEWIDRIFAVMAIAPHHTFQCLTKRAERMRAYMTDINVGWRIWKLAAVMETGQEWPHSGLPWPLPNLWMGISAEDQATANERVPLLLATPAVVRFVSAEPLLGPINFDKIHECSTTEGGAGHHSWESALNGKRFDPWSDGDIEGCPRLSWVIVGGESGPKARPLMMEWVEDIVSQCAEASVPVFVKQLGANAFYRISGAQVRRLKKRARKGDDISEWPESLRVQQWPHERSAP